VLAGIFGVICIAKMRLIRSIYIPSMGELKQAYVDGWSLFVASASSGLQASTNVFVLGLVSSRAQVEFYDAADRVKGTAIAPLSAIASAYFPLLNRLMAADRPKAKRLLLYLAAVITGHDNLLNDPLLSCSI
jgi:PST family polysaccharide transporter